MKVAVPRAQHSPRFGQAAEAQTVWSRCSRTARCTASKAGVMRTRTRSHGGFSPAGPRAELAHGASQRAAKASATAARVAVHEVGGRARAELARERAHLDVREPARDDRGEVRRIERDVEREAVEADPAAQPDADRGELARAAGGGREDAGAAGQRSRRDAEFVAIAATRSASMPRRKRCTSAAPRAARSIIEVADELARPVIGHAPAARRLDDVDAARRERRAALEQVRGIAACDRA